MRGAILILGALVSLHLVTSFRSVSLVSPRIPVLRRHAVQFQKEDSVKESDTSSSVLEDAGIPNDVDSEESESWYKRLLSRRNQLNNGSLYTEAPPPIVVHNLPQLRHKVLNRKIPLGDIAFAPNFTASHRVPVVNATTSSPEELAAHPVLQLLAQRVLTNSTPGNRAANDTAHIALSIEGGGMRGAVSAGMAAAIASLGLTDALDSVYGSSAGSIVGAYMCSRQMCVDVYTTVLPAAKGRFASKRRVVGNLGVGLVNDWVQRSLSLQRPFTTTDPNKDASDETSNAETTRQQTQTTTDEEMVSISRLASALTRFTPNALSEYVPAILSSVKPYLKLHPGMNVSFVLDGVMSEQHGLRPFDMQSFRRNDAKQPLYAVASTVRNGKLETVAFSSQEGDYFDMQVILNETTMPEINIDPEVEPEGRVRRVLRVVKGTVVRVGKIPVRVYGAVRSLVRHQKDSTASEEKATNGEEKAQPPKKKKMRKLITAAKSPLFRRLREPPKTSPILNKVRRTSNGTLVREASACPYDSGKQGFFACIESSMLVPGAAGAPVKLLRSKHRNEAQRLGVDSMANTCFDAFCYEPVPYRSAVENGATHVLALRSRPDGCAVPTVPGVYEKLVAPIYFRRYELPQVVRYFESGGSQYRYLEDVLTLDEGLSVGCREGLESKGIRVPPTDILFGTEYDDELQQVDTDSWKRAHLMPLMLPAGTPELPTLTQDKDEVLLSVRNGFAAAFDILAPIAGLDFDPSTVDSKKIAELVFPRNDDEDDMYVLENPVNVKGDYIQNMADMEVEKQARKRFVDWIRRKRKARRRDRWMSLRNPFSAVAVEKEREMPDTKQYASDDSLDWLEAESLLAMLPGFQEGKLSHLSGGLRSVDDDGEAQRDKSYV